jgi:hypothetical protein
MHPFRCEIEHGIQSKILLAKWNEASELSSSLGTLINHASLGLQQYQPGTACYDYFNNLFQAATNVRDVYEQPVYAAHGAASDWLNNGGCSNTDDAVFNAWRAQLAALMTALSDALLAFKDQVVELLLDWLGQSATCPIQIIDN